MANTIKLKNSAVAAKVPLTTDLVYGEVALNYADGKIFYKRSDNTIQSISGGGSAITVSDEGNTLTTTLTSLNFAGSGVTATNVAGAVTVNVTGGGGGGGSSWNPITTSTTASTGGQYLVSSSVGTLTLPSSPTAGNSVVVMDGGNWAITNLTIARNGSTIESIAQDLVCDIAGTVLTLVYDGTTWQVTANIGPAGPTGATGATGATGGVSTGKAIAMAMIFGG